MELAGVVDLRVGCEVSEGMLELVQDLGDSEHIAEQAVAKSGRGETSVSGIVMVVVKIELCVSCNPNVGDLALRSKIRIP